MTPSMVLNLPPTATMTGLVIMGALFGAGLRGIVDRRSRSSFVEVDHVQAVEEVAAVDPQMSARDVVVAQLQALQRVDPGLKPGHDPAMRSVYQFASPGNREAIGTLTQFDRLLRGDMYSPLIAHEAATVGRATQQGAFTIVVASILTAGGDTAAYRFQLGRSPCPGLPKTSRDAARGNRAEQCWMTDACYRMMLRSGRGD